jgi:hypothetical protein
MCVQEDVTSSTGAREAKLICAAPLGSVSGSKAALATVHAKLEAMVLRARRHQGLRHSTANARAGAA